MPRSFSLPPFPGIKALKEPRVLVRAGLGLLLAANLVAASFAFHLFGSSPESLNQDLISAQTRVQAEQVKLTRSRRLTTSIDKGKGESETFLKNYLTDHRRTYSTIIGEIRGIEKSTGMTVKEETIAPLDPIEGSDDLDMMTLTVNFEGTYPQIVKFVNLIDRSPRFLIIESMTASPQTKGDNLKAKPGEQAAIDGNIKLNAFVKDDTGGAL